MLGGLTIGGLAGNATTLDRMHDAVPFAEWADIGRPIDAGAGWDRPGAPVASLRFWQAVANEARDASDRTGLREVTVIGGARSGLAVARLLAHRLVVMRRGRVVEHGLTDRVLDDPQHEYTQLLVSSVLAA